LIKEFDDLFNECTEAFNQSRVARKVQQLSYGLINCPGRHTLSGMITSIGKQFVDWSSTYRLFQGSRVDIDSIFSVVRESLINNELNSDDNIYSHMDDTTLKKSGKKVFGTAWRRDPLGPPFHTNFLWGQRYLQLSISLPEDPSAISRSRAIPVEFIHCHTVKKPKKSDDPQQWEEYKEKKKIVNLSRQGAERIKILRENLDNQGAGKRKLVISVDGSFTNENVIKKLPERTILIGRIRKDTSLHKVPDDEPGKSAGRKKIYGEKIPKPEEIRKSEKYDWQEVQAWAAGKTHKFNLKIVDKVRWRKAGNRNLKLVIIRPLAYRLTKNSRFLYRQPAYLICTDPELQIEKLLQAYIWRWEIEVNFRDEKSLLGCGQAQVRVKDSVEKVPAFIVAVYSLLHLAAHRVRKQGNSNQLPKAKWYKDRKESRETTGDIINAFRSQLLANSMDINFYDFVKLQQSIKDRKNYVDTAISAHFYCRN
jgi:hypothetical protein